jgi:hypothetical protein
MFYLLESLSRSLYHPEDYGDRQRHGPERHLSLSLPPPPPSCLPPSRIPHQRREACGDRPRHGHASLVRSRCRTYTHTHTHTHESVPRCIQKRRSLYWEACPRWQQNSIICMCACVRVCVCIHTYIYIYIYTIPSTKSTRTT